MKEGKAKLFLLWLPMEFEGLALKLLDMPESSKSLLACGS
jgi:hypothetical protein